MVASPASTCPSSCHLPLLLMHWLSEHLRWSLMPLLGWLHHQRSLRSTSHALERGGPHHERSLAEVASEAEPQVRAGLGRAAV